MTFPRRKLPAALAWLGRGLFRRASARLRGHLSEIDVPRQADSMAQYERRP